MTAAPLSEDILAAAWAMCPNFIDLTRPYPSIPGRLVVAIDPGDNASGVATWRVGELNGLEHAVLVKINRAGWTQEHAIALLDDLIGDSEWLGVCEKPPNAKFGFRASPEHAQRYWLDVFDLLARRRSKRYAQRFRKPLVLRPQHDEWRHPIGIRTRGIPGDAKERRQKLKEAAIALLSLQEGVEVTQSDMAEACCIAKWAARAVRHALVPMRGKKPLATRFSA